MFHLVWVKSRYEDLLYQPPYDHVLLKTSMLFFELVPQMLQNLSGLSEQIIFLSVSLSLIDQSWDDLYEYNGLKTSYSWRRHIHKMLS